MNWARRETIQTLFEAACEMPVVDCHTHVQDDLTEFDAALAEKNLAGTQAAMNAYPEHIIASAIENGQLVRRTMMDVAHGCCGDELRQVRAVVTEAMLEALDEIGADLKAHGASHGSCLQIAMGVSYFMDPSREIQSFPMYAAGVAQDEYPVWMNYPHIQFEYIIAHDQLYEDMANAAKQVGNVSVGPWWHFFRTHKIAGMLRDQLSMGPVSSIASGFTDARFVEMLVAKYRSIRYAVALALADLVDDPASSMSADDARPVMREILYTNPIRCHHLPIDLD